MLKKSHHDKREPHRKQTIDKNALQGNLKVFYTSRHSWGFKFLLMCIGAMNQDC